MKKVVATFFDYVAGSNEHSAIYLEKLLFHAKDWVRDRDADSESLKFYADFVGDEACLGKLLTSNEQIVTQKLMGFNTLKKISVDRANPGKSFSNSNWKTLKGK